MENNMFAHAITVHHKLKVKTLKNMDSIDHWMEKPMEILQCFDIQ